MPFPRRNTWLQILFWGALWAMIPLLLAGGWDAPERYIVRGAVVWSVIALTVWANMEWLIPRLFFQKKQAAYALAALALVCALTFLVAWDAMPWAAHFGRPGGPGRSGVRGWGSMKYIGMAMPYVTALLGSALFEIAAFASRKEKEAAEMLNQKLEAELKFLKSQINPHFLFNALNNIYSLTVLRSEQAPENLLKLSGMLRYMLHDCKADRVPLHKEIEYLRHFIDLCLLKDSRGLQVTADLDGCRPDFPVAPLLLIPFVENAFKHSKIEDREKGWIRIRLRTGETHLEFRVENSIPAQPFAKDPAGGIGLGNVRRQLELLYPNRHDLQIDAQEDVFSVVLRVEERT